MKLHIRDQLDKAGHGEENSSTRVPVDDAGSGKQCQSSNPSGAVPQLPQNGDVLLGRGLPQ
jgi:hypothetical protein